MRTEYVEKYKTLTFKNWDDVYSLATTLLRAKYNLKITSRMNLSSSGKWEREYSLDFRHEDFDYARFQVSDQYTKEIKDDQEYVYVRQGMSFTGSDPALGAAKTLLNNDYEVVVWTDGETFGDEYPRHYAVEFVHKSEGVGINEKWF